MKAETVARDLLLKAIYQAGLTLEHEDLLTVAEPKQKGHGDLTCNIALVLAKQEGVPPRQLAERITACLDRGHPDISGVEVGGAGFINLTLSPEFLHSGLSHIMDEGKNYGRSDWGKEQKTQVEFVSANPTGPLTIGHGRQAVIGDTIARLLEATGHRVTREYYFNDAGRQMRLLGDSVRLRYLEMLGVPVSLGEDHYQGDYIKDIASRALEEKGETLSESQDLSYFSQLAEEAVFEDIKQTLERLSIAFDVFYNEKSLYETGKIEAVIAALKEKDLVYKAEGALWFRTSTLGMDQDRVIVKSSGEPTYRLPDIAYHKDKLDRGFDRVIDIFGADHVATYPDVLAAIKALGYDESKVTVLIHQFVTLMEGGETVKMSTRKATFVTLDELIDEVGADVTRYFFINRSANSHLNFDLNLARKQSDENPVYYVQYAHARICSIIRHAESRGIDSGNEADLSLLQTREEIDLIKALLSFPEVVSQAARDLEPHHIPTYLEEVATVYHKFQHAGRVDERLRVVGDDMNLTQARLTLCRAARTVLANGLDLLGIGAPEQM